MVASEPYGRTLWPWISIVIILAAAAFQLRHQGRLWICSCDRVFLWVGDARSSGTSQHLLDPYSFTHISHGFVFCWLLWLVVSRLSWTWRLCIAIAAEAVWEVVENSEFVIERYREGNAALGYFGDTVVNSLGDIAVCGVGFMLARYLGFWRSLALFVAVEAVLAFWIRDGLILNIIALIHPVEWIQQWQAGY